MLVGKIEENPTALFLQPESPNSLPCGAKEGSPPPLRARRWGFWCEGLLIRRGKEGTEEVSATFPNLCHSQLQRGTCPNER